MLPNPENILFPYLLSIANGGEYIFRLAQASSSHAVTISVQNTNVPELHISPLMYELMGEGIIVITARLYGYEDIMSVYWQCDMVEGTVRIIVIKLKFSNTYISARFFYVNSQWER